MAWAGKEPRKPKFSGFSYREAKVKYVQIQNQD
jgi:hypothetical protein